MRQRVSMIAAPTGLSPGGYVKAAYADRSSPRTPIAEVDATQSGRSWRIRVEWKCPEAITRLDDNVDRFVDSAAILAPGVPDAPWMTMGAPGKAVEGAMWRADQDVLFGVRAEGLGSVERSGVPDGWVAKAEWNAGRWRVDFELSVWPVLDTQRKLAIAIWQGAESERGGLKSVSSDWIELGP